MQYIHAKICRMMQLPMLLRYSKHVDSHNFGERDFGGKAKEQFLGGEGDSCLSYYAYRKNDSC